MKKLIFSLYILLITLHTNAQDVEMADVLRSSGKIYVVVSTVAIVFLGIIFYLFKLDKRINKLEE